MLTLADIDLPPSQGSIRLRWFSETDAAAVANAYRDEAIPRQTATSLLLGNERVARFWIGTHEEQRLESAAAHLAIVDAVSDELLGALSVVEIDWEHHSANIGYWVVAAHRRRGIATQAVRLVVEWLRVQTSLRRFALVIMLGNVASEKLASALGFVPGEPRYGEAAPGSDERFDVATWILEV